LIYTVGHSTRPSEEFIGLIRAHRIDQLADIRAVPRSQRHPHFSADALSRSLSSIGVGYRHFRALGGLRKPRPDSPNGVWHNPGFRGYADYMETDAFVRALDELVRWAGLGAPGQEGAAQAASAPGARRALPTVVMCAEAVWWRCHRQLLADALTARGIPVAHITSTAPPIRHTLTEFARVVDGGVSYRRLI
jgi:uncharacterized protein (DUF488 family)